MGNYMYNYIVSDGPFSEYNDYSGTEIPVWYVSEYDKDDNEKWTEKFYSYEKAFNFAENQAKLRHIEHVIEATRN